MAKKVYIAEFDAKGNAYNRKIAEAEARTLKASDRMAKSFNKMGGAIVAAFSIQQVLEFGKELVNLGNKIRGVENAFKRIDKGNYLERLRKATHGTIDDLKLMQSAVFSEKFNIPFDVLVKGMEFAGLTAQETGEDFNYMMESFVKGTARESAKILDNLGISSKELSEEIKKTGNFMTALGNIMDRELAKMRDSMDETILLNQQMNTEIENYKQKVAVELSGAWNTATGFMAEHFVKGINFLGDFATMIEESFTGDWLSFEPLEKFIAKLVGIKTEMEKIEMMSPHLYKPMIDDGKKTASTIGEIKKEITDLTSDLDETVFHSKEWYEISGKIKTLQASITEETEKQKKRMDELAQSAGKYAEALGGAGGAIFKGEETYQSRQGRSGNMPGGDATRELENQKDVLQEYRQELSVVESAVGSLFDTIYIRASSNADVLESIFVNMANVFIREVQRMIAQWIAFSVIRGILGIASGGASMALPGLARGGSVTNSAGNISYTPIPKFASGVSSFMVPPGYPNDSFPIMVQSGERVDVTPAHGPSLTDRLLKQISDRVLANSMVQSRRSTGGSQVIEAHIYVDGRDITRAVKFKEKQMLKEGETFVYRKS